MSIAAPTPQLAPQPSHAAADAESPPGECRVGGGARFALASQVWQRLCRTRIAQWLGPLAGRWNRGCRQLNVRPAIAPCAISVAVHAALVGGLSLCVLATRLPSGASELIAEVELLRQPPAIDVQMPDNLPEVAQPAGTVSGGGGHTVMRRSADIDPALWTPEIEPALLLASTFAPVADLTFDRELAPERRPAPRARQPRQPVQLPAEKAAEDDRTVIELPVGFKGVGGMFAGRQPNFRPLLIKQLGGTDETEAAVKRGLQWLKKHQQPDGRWCLHSFGSLPDCHGQCTHAGILSDTAGTALALLPFLAVGSTHLEGEYAPVVARGLAWLMHAQKNDGGWSDGGIVKMYAHGQATIALAEAYAMSGDRRLLDSLTRAIDIIAEHQDEGGGWRYIPDQEGDNSVTGWQLMALRSARAGGVEVPQSMFDNAMVFLNTVQPDKTRGLFCYGPKHPVTEAMTGEGLLSREYGGWSYDNPALKSGIAELLKSYMPRRDKPNMYYWYYATQTLHHVGGKAWQKWNEPMREMLVDLQIKEGHMAGSWTPKEQHDQAGGRLYMTALGTCTLAVYYRHLPIYAKYTTAGEKEKKAPPKN